MTAEIRIRKSIIDNMYNADTDLGDIFIEGMTIEINQDLIQRIYDQGLINYSVDTESDDDYYIFTAELEVDGE